MPDRQGWDPELSSSSKSIGAKSTGRLKRWGIPALLAMGLVGGLAGLGNYLAEGIRTDLHRDLVWFPHRESGQVPEVLYTRSERWFPLTVLIGWRWTASPVGSRRFEYAAFQVTRQGQLLRGWWLERLLRLNPDLGYGYSSALTLVLGEYDQAPDWQLFGLDRPERASQIAELAIRHVDPNRESWAQFNLRLLERLLSKDYPHHLRVWGVVVPAIEAIGSSDPAKARLLIQQISEDERMPQEWDLQVARLRQDLLDIHVPSGSDAAGLSAWDGIDQIEAISDPTLEQIRGIAEQVNPSDQAFFLSRLMGGEDLIPAGLDYGAELAADPDYPEQITAAVHLSLQQDPRGQEVLAAAVNGDLSRLHGIWDYLILLHLAETFPDSRLTRGARAYAAIRGGTYFGHIGYDDETGEWIPRPFAPAAEERQWRDWLREYTDHPGADDATYWLGRTQEWQGRMADALITYADWLTDPVGDRDMTYHIRLRFLTLLDVGVDPEDLAQVVRDQAAHPLSSLFHYGLAVRRARQHDYTQALELSQMLTLDPVIQQTPGWHWNRWWYNQDLGSSLDSQLAQQRLRWQTLQRWQRMRTPQERIHLAQDWGSWTGWRNGYLVLFNGFRNGGTGYAYWQDPQTATVDQALARQGLQQANHNAQAITLVQPLLEDPDTPAPMIEQALWLQLSTLYRQYASYPPAETLGMVPLMALGDPDPTLFEVTVPDWVQNDSRYYNYYLEQSQQQAWYIRHAIRLARELISRFPQTHLGDDALLGVYELTQDPGYLEELLQRFPAGDRSEEARVWLVVRHNWDLADLEQIQPLALAQRRIRSEMP